MSNASTRAALNARRERQGQAARKHQELTALLADPKQLADFAAVAPRGYDPQLLINDLMVSLRQEPALLDCRPATVIGAATTCAQLGLRVGVLGHAWIVPREDNDVAQLIIGYKGYRDLALRSEHVTSCYAKPVYANDQYDSDSGTANYLVHKRNRRTSERGEVTDYYAIAHLSKGGHVFWEMSRAEVEAHRDRWARRAPGENGELGPVVGAWEQHFDAMAAKTVLRALVPAMPMSTELNYALEADFKVRADSHPHAITSGYVPAPEPARAPAAPGVQTTSPADREDRPDRS